LVHMIMVYDICRLQTAEFLTNAAISVMPEGGGPRDEVGTLNVCGHPMNINVGPTIGRFEQC